MTVHIDLSPQQALDFVYEAIAKQDCRSIERGRVSHLDIICQYRGAKGAKCAIGHLIPDEEYQREWDSCGEPLTSLVSAGDVVIPQCRTYEVLCQLQTAHDSCQPDASETFGDRWYDLVSVITKAFQLTMPPRHNL